MTTDRNSEGAGTTSAPVAFNYAALHRFAMENRVDYNALARLVRESVYTPPASIPAAEVQALVERLEAEATEWAAIHQRTSHGHRVDWEAHGKAEAYERAAELVAKLIPRGK